MINKVKSILKYGAVIVIILLILKTLGWSWVKGDMVGYTKMCYEWSKDDDCLKYYPSQPDIYKIDAGNNQVFRLNELSVDKYSKCTIADKQNWTCKYDDESGEFGFALGKYFSRGLDSEKYSIKRLALEELGISRFQWLDSKSKECGLLYPLCYLLAF